jgi:ABC-type antimicrobial peptide transport system permease subunit
MNAITGKPRTAIGFIFGFGSIMGLIVGMVIIVYRILFSDIANHLREYATLKAILAIPISIWRGWSWLPRLVLAAAWVPAGVLGLALDV